MSSLLWVSLFLFLFCRWLLGGCHHAGERGWEEEEEEVEKKKQNKKNLTHGEKEITNKEGFIFILCNAQ